MARPRKEIDFDILEKYCGIMCTAEEIAWLMDISADTLDRRIRERFDYGFADYYKKASSKGKASLRRKQYEVAMSGNVSMLIWMGKQHLNQSEKIINRDHEREEYETPESLTPDAKTPETN